MMQRLFIVISWLSGLFPIQNPWAYPLNKIRFSWMHPVIVVSIIYPIYPIVIFQEAVSSAKNVNKETKSVFASLNISYLFVVELTAMIEAALIMFSRLLAIYFSSDITQIIQQLYNLKVKFISSSCSAFHTRSKSHVVVFYIFPATLAYFGGLVSTVYFAVNVWNWKRWFVNISIVLTSSPTLFAVVCVYIQYSITCPLYYCVLFISIFGLELTSVHDLIAENLIAAMHFHLERQNSQTLGTSINAPDVSSIRSNHQPCSIFVKTVNATNTKTNKTKDTADSDADKKTRMLETVLILKALLQKFTRVGGTYCIVLLIFGMTSIVKGIGFLMFPNACTPTWKVMLHIWFGVYVIWIVVSIGNYMATRMAENRENVLHAVGQYYFVKEADQRWVELADLFIKWRWTLTARDYCDVNYRLVPGIFGFIVTYFIFIFQLMTTE